ncbi:succinate dehydrogenase/fumarate reductase iron-sulfur subunit [Ammoniphilus sp. CFH 90114]|uniref:succinate dehydrogenase/fumarate reductase iron-sulfur subunit n=1 Tax=Ammoniphilus sp. CFH 90114 TaxID=2493665 RepID=UPI00100E48BB|nr:succinate dehydrogenase iron-sulfur subunit [Ammoniphilus sp. CFH 90114]RXT07206.1 succinate dehydrogenase iron-sulfur subunit [Ammoniphilus sp. CFH 90114]
MEGEVKLHVLRYEPENDEKARYDTFVVDAKDNMTVLDALFIILSEQDPTVSFRCSCRVGMCGSCGMVMNDKEGLACRTKIEKLGREITVRPLRNLPIVKDLAVNMDPFFKQWEKIKPYFVPNAEASKDFAQIPQDPSRRGIIDQSLDCITCGCCYSACTLVSLDDNYIGPAALNRAYTLVADERDAATESRMEVAAGEDGALRCHTLFNCMEVCPKNLVPTWSIQKIKTKAVAGALKGGSK